MTITGTDLTGATAVKFGSKDAASFSVSSATKITATSPAGSLGTVDITVTTPGGTSATSSADQFSYAVPADSLKVRALQNAITPMVAQTSGQVITSAIDGAINDAFSPSNAPFTGGPNGITFNFAADPQHNDPASAELQRAKAFAAGTLNNNPNDPGLRVNSFAGEPQPSRRVDDAFTALGYAGNATKAPPRQTTPEREWRLWLDVRGTGWTTSNNSNADIKGNQLNLTMGLSRKLTPDMVVGVVAGHENFKYDVTSLTGTFKGNGETVGGYFARRFGALRFDAALAWSYMSYSASAGTANGSFTGSRWLASTGLTGYQKFGAFSLEPSAKVFVLWERENTWTDNLGTLQDTRTFSAGRASGGTKIARPFDLPDGSKIAPFIGVYGDYRFLSDNAVATGQPVVAISQGWSARVTTGASYMNDRGMMLSLGGEYGGIGANYKIWSGNVRGMIPF